jgi:hypothetical protein
LQATVLLPERVPILEKLRIHRYASHGADLHALGFVKMTDTFGTFLGIDLVDFWPQKNGQIRTFGLANIAIDTLVGDDQSHRLPSTTSSTMIQRNNMQQIIGDAAF